MGSFVRIVAIVLASFAVIGMMSSGVGAQGTPSPSPSPAFEVPPIVWEWVSFTDPAKGEVPVLNPAAYTVQFAAGGRVFLQADCNRGVGDYVVEGSNLTISPLATTLMLCPPLSRDGEFLAALTSVASWSVNQDEASDLLVLELADDAGSMVFQPSLSGVEWHWNGFQGGDGSESAPAAENEYTLNFGADGSVIGQISCNRGVGSFTGIPPQISIEMASTRALCQDNEISSQYLTWLSEANSFVIRDGKLALALPMDGGILTFSAHLPEELQETGE